jgi:putative phosphoribosyl transferase
MEYRDRAEAGRWLAIELSKYQGLHNVVVLGLAGGGIPIANEVSRSLKIPADILVVRKLKLSEEPEVVIGAITSGGAQVINDALVKEYDLTPLQLDALVAQEKVELELKEQRYRGSRPFPSLQGQTVIVVDDGMATGSSMRVALNAIKQQKPARIVMALPVAPPTVYADFKELADEIVCLMTPKNFIKVRDYYLEYHAVTDEEIHTLLKWVAERVAAY